MNTRKLSVGFVSLSLFSAAGAWTLAQPAGQPAAQAAQKEGEEAGEETIDFAKAPEAVRAAALKLVGAGGEKAIKKVVKEEDEDVYTYEVEYTEGGVECAAIISVAGDVLEVERATTEAKLPAAVMAALKKDYPRATFASPFAVTKTFYEIEVVIDGKKHEVKVDAAGNIEDESEGDGDGRGKGHGEGHGGGEKHADKKD